MNVASPCGGKVISITAKIGESYPVGAVLGYIELSPQEAQRLGLDAQESAAAPSPANGAGGVETGSQARRAADGARIAGAGPRRRAPLTCPRA